MIRTNTGFVTLFLREIRNLLYLRPLNSKFMNQTVYILAPYPKSEAPSQRFRFEQYLASLEQNGFDVHYHPFLDEKAWQNLYAKGKVIHKASGMIRAFCRRWLLLFQLRKADFVFIHREAAHLGPPVFEWIIAKLLRKRIIYDFDDAIWLPNYSDTNALFHRLKAYWKVKYIIKWSYKVSAGNQYLADFASRYTKHIEIIPTTIDTEGHHNQSANHDHQPLIIGWTGTHTTMRYLDELIPVLQNLEKKYDFRFRIISNQPPHYNLESLEFIKWNKASEIKDLAELHIGVMPLQPDIWAEGKCGFKALQYMALGIAAVASPVGVNTTIIQHGVTGFLASTPEEWSDCLEQLIRDYAIRVQLGNAGKLRVKNHFSVLAITPRFISLFS